VLIELMRHMLNWAVGREYLDRTPFRRGTETLIRKLQEDNRRRRRISEDEETRLLEVAPPFLRSMIITGLDTGTRQGEMLALQLIVWRPRSRDEVPLRERAARSGLQIPLKAQRGLLGRKFQNDQQRPRTVLGGMAARTCVVPFDTILDVTRHAGVMTAGIGVALEQVHEALANATHAGAKRHGSDQMGTGVFWREFAAEYETVHISASRGGFTYRRKRVRLRSPRVSQ
jgi:hypothetical protein